MRRRVKIAKEYNFMVQLEYRKKWAANPEEDLPGYSLCQNRCSILDFPKNFQVHRSQPIVNLTRLSYKQGLQYCT